MHDVLCARCQHTRLYLMASTANSSVLPAEDAPAWFEHGLPLQHASTLWYVTHVLYITNTAVLWHRLQASLFISRQCWMAFGRSVTGLQTTSISSS
jgi:hypothetical protein